MRTLLSLLASVVLTSACVSRAWPDEGATTNSSLGRLGRQKMDDSIGKVGPSTPAEAVAVLAQRQGAGPVPGGDSKEYTYKTTPQGELKMYVDFPPGWRSQDARPAIVFFFGGGWRAGSVQQFAQQAKYLASRGMVAARADYRVESRHDATPDKCAEDAKSALRWLRQNAAMLGIDPKRLVGAGGSAGAHIAACAATSPGLDAEGEDTDISSKPNVLVLFNPVLNVAGVERLVERVGSRETAEAISPTRHLSKDAPPTIMFYGTEDRLLVQGEEFLKKAKELDLRVELYTAEGVGHGFFNKPPWRQVTIHKADEFLASLGYLEGRPTVELPAASPELKAAESADE